MIVSIISESQWVKSLSSLSIWSPSTEDAVVIAPHPDDETLGVGGLIARLIAEGVNVTVVAVTDGERAYEGSVGLGDIRRTEQSRALSHLGVRENKIIRLGLPDSKVIAHESELVRALCENISAKTQLIAPWRGDYHPDHEACGRAAEAAASIAHASLISYFFWTWHRGTPADLEFLNLRRLPLTPVQFEVKHNALREHHTQLQHESGEPILPENLLRPAYRTYEVIAIS